MSGQNFVLGLNSKSLIKERLINCVKKQLNKLFVRRRVRPHANASFLYAL